MIETMAGPGAFSLPADRIFDQVFHMEQRRILALAFRITGNLADAQDAAQEAFLRLHQNWKTLAAEPDDAIHVWLRRVVVNLCLDGHRRRQRLTFAPIEADVQDHAEDPEQSALGLERAVRLQAALLQLPERERTVLVLRELEGMATAEVAADMGTAEATVRVQLAKARLKLREILKGGAS